MDNNIKITVQYSANIYFTYLLQIDRFQIQIQTASVIELARIIKAVLSFIFHLCGDMCIYNIWYVIYFALTPLMGASMHAHSGLRSI